MSTKMKRLSLFFIMAILLAGCATARAATQGSTPIPTVSASNNQYAPQPGDNSLSMDTATFVSAATSKAGPDVQLQLSYRLPNPCHLTRIVVNPPDPTGRINVKLYSVFEPNKPCTLMALATPLQATVDLGSYPAGHYTIYMNDEKAAEFDE
jgi:hypothetical protein